MRWRVGVLRVCVCVCALVWKERLWGGNVERGIERNPRDRLLGNNK